MEVRNKGEWLGLTEVMALTGMTRLLLTRRSDSDASDPDHIVNVQAPTENGKRLRQYRPADVDEWLKRHEK